VVCESDTRLPIEVHGSLYGAGVPLVEPMQEAGMKLQGEEAPYDDIVEQIMGVDGVVCCGLLPGGVVSEVLVAGPDGPQTLRKVPPSTCFLLLLCSSCADKMPNHMPLCRRRMAWWQRKESEPGKLNNQLQVWADQIAAARLKLRRWCSAALSVLGLCYSSSPTIRCPVRVEDQGLIR
jgi:hypothetical protein